MAIGSMTLAGLDVRVVDVGGLRSVIDVAAAPAATPPDAAATPDSSAPTDPLLPVGPQRAAAPVVPATPLVVMLHGFSMRADDLAPFGASMGLPATFVFPEGPVDLQPHGRTGRAWWLIDVAARDAAVAAGTDRDLSNEVPAGLPAARERLAALVDSIRQTWPGRPLFLGGFSQGAILSLDFVLRTPDARPRGLVLLSGAKVDARALSSLWPRAAGLPVFQSHGRNDRELSFRAAVDLHEQLIAAGADVGLDAPDARDNPNARDNMDGRGASGWWPFDGGHEIPLPIWRELKKFIRRHAQDRR